MTVTVEDVKRIHGEQLALGKSASDALMSTRTLVHAQMQLDRPVPYGYEVLTPEMKAERDPPGRILTVDERQAQSYHQWSKVTPAEQELFNRARFARDRNAVQCADAHHYVQMLHQTELWKATDQLVAEAGVQ
jgi:hypothetical protein